MSELKVKVKRIDKNLDLPIYQTDGAVGFDLICRLESLVLKGELALLPVNLIVKVPKGYALILASRSSTPKKKGLLTPHGIGVVDLDYNGPEDELKVQVFNFTDKDVKVERGERIAQGIFVRVDRFEFEEIEETGKISRGGFGSTG